jgi:hypothetical protein
MNMSKTIHNFAINGLRLGLVVTVFFVMFSYFVPTAARATDDESKTAEQLCDENDSDSWQKQLVERKTLYAQQAAAAGYNAYGNMPVSNTLECILTLKSYFSNISSILSGLLNGIVGVLLTIVNTVINAICQYLVNIVKEVLNMICLPIPNLGFSLSMPSTSSGYCNGLSLGSFISVSGRGGMFPSGMPMMSVPPNMSLGAQYYQKRSQ